MLSSFKRDVEEHIEARVFAARRKSRSLAGRRDTRMKTRVGTFPNTSGSPPSVRLVRAATAATATDADNEQVSRQRVRGVHAKPYERPILISAYFIRVMLLMTVT